MKSDGTELKKLTNGSLNDVGAGGGAPAWSLDGTRIAYVTTTNGTTDIWSMGADGSNKRRLTSTNDQDIDPVWTPDGDAITFRRTSGMTRQTMLFSVSSANGTPVYRFGDYGDGAMPSYSPDGRYLTFTRYSATGGAMFALPLMDTVGPRTVAAPTGGAYGVEPANAVWMRRP